MVGASQIHEAPNWNIHYLVPPPLQDNPDAPPEPPFHNVTQVDRGTGDYLGINYKGFSAMSAFTEWQTEAYVQGAVGETRQAREFGDLGYEHKVRDNWDMTFNFDYTRTTFITFAYPYTDRDSNEIVAEWTNLITLTSKDRLTTIRRMFMRRAPWSRWRSSGSSCTAMCRRCGRQPSGGWILRPGRSPVIGQRETDCRLPIQ